AFLVYSLADPLSPSLVSNTPITTEYGLASDMIVSGNTVLVPAGTNSLFFGEFEGQFGNVLSLDVSNPSAPTVAGMLFPSTDPNVNTFQYDATIVNSQIAYIASSTSTGGSTQSGEGRVLVENYSNPADLTYSEVD